MAYDDARQHSKRRVLIGLVIGALTLLSIFATLIAIRANRHLQSKLTLTETAFPLFGVGNRWQMGPKRFSFEWLWSTIRTS